MKKIIVQILLFVIIFNCIFNNFCYAVDEEAPTGAKGFNYSEDAYNSANQDGITENPGGGTSQVDAADTQSGVASMIGNLAAFISVLPLAAVNIIEYVTGSCGYIDVENLTKDANGKNLLTIQNIIFGNYYLLNANIFKDSTSLQVSSIDGTAPDDTVDILNTLRNNVSQWYYLLKLISLILGLLTLIYIGIRMALSTVSSDKAKYKKMLISWFQSIGIILILPYLMRLLNYINEILLDFAILIKGKLGSQSFEVTIFKNINDKFNECGGMELAAYAIAYLVLMWAQFKFFMMYIKRVFAVSFLTIISPLISITYSIDKAGDGRAQAFSGWLQEYLMNMLIQPLQAFLYLIFVFSANSIAEQAPILGIVFLLSLTRAERIAKTIFNMRNMVSIHTMKLFGKGKG